MGDFSSSSSIKKYNSFGNTSAITTASARKDIQYKNSKDSNELLHYGTVKGEDVVETFTFGNAAAGTYSNVHAEFKVSDTASYNIADLIRGSFTDSEGNSYFLYGSDSDNEQLKAVVDWLRDEVEERYNPSHSSQFYQFTSDEEMEKYVCEIIGIDDTNREALIESFKLNNASQLKEGKYTYSDIFAGVIQNKMLEAYQTYQNEIFEEDAAKYKHFEEQYLLKQLDQMSVIYSDYAGFDISTLSDEEKIKWFYKFIDNEAKLDFANDEYKERFNEAETNAEKENIFAENCMYMASVRMAEIDEQRFQDSLTWLEKIGGVVYETGKRIGENFSTLWNSDSFDEAIKYIITDGTLQFFNDLQDGLFTLGGYAIKGVGHVFVDDDELWDQAVGESVYMYNEGNIADEMLQYRMKNDENFSDPEYLEMYYAARQLGRDGEMMIINMLGAPEIALPVSIITATGQQYNSAIAQGADYVDAIDYGTASGVVNGSVDFLLGRALGHVGGKAANSAVTAGAKSTFETFGKILAANGGGKMFIMNTLSAAANPYVDTFFKAATFSDDSFSDLVVKDKVVENSVIAAGKSVITMTAMGYFKGTKAGMKFEQISGKIREKTSFKNSKNIFVKKKSDDVSGTAIVDGVDTAPDESFTSMFDEKLKKKYDMGEMSEREIADFKKVYEMRKKILADKEKFDVDLIHKGEITDEIVGKSVEEISSTIKKEFFEDAKTYLSDSLEEISKGASTTEIAEMRRKFENHMDYVYEKYLDDEMWTAAKKVVDSKISGAELTIEYGSKEYYDAINSEKAGMLTANDNEVVAIRMVAAEKARKQMFGTQEKMLASITDGVNGAPKAYDSAIDFYNDLSEKSAGKMSSRITDEYRDYVINGFTDEDGSSRAGAFYANGALKFVTEPVDGTNLQTALNSCVEKIEVKPGSFGRVGDKQFITPLADSDFLMKSIQTSGDGNVFETVGAATGLPIFGNDRLVRVSIDIDPSTLTLHSGSEGGSNYQGIPGGLPEYTTADGTTHALREALIPATPITENSGLVFENYNTTTGQLISKYTLQLIDGKFYMVLVK